MTIRPQFYDQLQWPNGVGGAALPLAGVNVIPYHLNDDGTEGSIATAFSSRLSTVSTSAGTVTDSAGKISYYLDVGNYNIHYSDPNTPKRVPDRVQEFTAATVGSLGSITTILASVDGFLAHQIVGSTVYRGTTDSIAATTAYTLMPNPDLVSNVVVNSPLDLIAVWYSARWNYTTGFDGSPRAAIFLNENQLRVPTIGGSKTQAAAHNGNSNIRSYLSTTKHGLMHVASGSYTVDVATGQAIGFAAGNRSGSTSHEIGGLEGFTDEGQIQGGPCFIEVAPGVYNVSVRFKSSLGAGSIVRRDGRLNVAVIPFPSI